MTKLRLVGFFSDLSFGTPDQPTLRSQTAGEAAPDQDRMLEYLNDGELFMASPGIVPDVLSDFEARIASVGSPTPSRCRWRCARI